MSGQKSGGGAMDYVTDGADMGTGAEGSRPGLRKNQRGPQLVCGLGSHR